MNEALTKKTVLIIDDDHNAREALRVGLQREGYNVMVAEHGTKGLDICRQTPVDLVVTDLKMPGMDGLKFLKAFKALRPQGLVILLTGYGTIESAVEAIREGAYDYLTKPVRLPEVKKAVEKALQTQDLMRENIALRDKLNMRGREIIGASPYMQNILELVEQIAPTRTTVLVVGESGTGKELIAEAIHRRSPRAEGPFIKVNCAALPETLLESELFGYERGAFTGALRQKPGRFELAHGGTLFLDEIGDLPLNLQGKLLRVLQEGEFERLGGTKTLAVDVRIIVATNMDLAEAIDSKTFREDLYYRLNVITINIPPLRDRPEDIVPLIHHFVDKFSRINNKPTLTVHQDAMELLLSYPWPGNVRELENALEHAVVLSRSSIIEVSALPQALVPARKGGQALTFSLGTPLEEIERVSILKTLEKTGDNKEAAARMLGIGVATLYRKLKSYRGKA